MRLDHLLSKENTLKILLFIFQCTFKLRLIISSESSKIIVRSTFYGKVILVHCKKSGAYEKEEDID